MRRTFCLIEKSHIPAHIKISRNMGLKRRRRDSNPRAPEGKRISSAPRYDHFDTSPDLLPLTFSTYTQLLYYSRAVYKKKDPNLNLIILFADAGLRFLPHISPHLNLLSICPDSKSAVLPGRIHGASAFPQPLQSFFMRMAIPIILTC